MSCRYACTCAGSCWNCREKEPERYFGEAEDLRAQELGYKSYDDHMQSIKPDTSYEDTMDMASKHIEKFKKY